MKKIATCLPAPHTHTLTHKHTASVSCRAKRSIFYLCNVLLLMITTMKLQAQDPNWTKTYGTNLNDAGYSIAKTYDGGYIVGGTTTADNGNKDMLLLKLNMEGDTLWSQTFGGTYNDESFCVKQCRDSGFVIAGYKSTGSSNTDFYIIKTDASGNQQWNRTFGGALNEGSYSIIQTFDLGFAVCGYTGSIGAGAKDMMLLKYDQSGSFLWQKTYGGVEDELAYAITQTEDSGFVLVGSTKSYGENNLGDVYAIRTNSTGDTLWTRDYIYRGTEAAYDVTTVNGGYFIITGKTNSSGDSITATFDAFALKINNEGNTIFFTTYGSQYDECAYNIKEMPDLSYILVGTTNNPERGGTGNDIYMVKIGEWGDTISTLTYGTPYNDEARSFCIDDNENIVLVGKSFNPTTLNDIGVVAYPFCKGYYPRYIWVNNVFNDATPNENVLAATGINLSRLIQMVDYLATMRYSGVVITHMEDIFTNNDSTILLTQLAELITAMHNAGIPVVLNQFRSNEINRGQVASRKNHIKYLSSSIIYNQAVLTLARFDGLELDYEFWQKGYGLADDIILGTTPFQFIVDGYLNYLFIANQFKLAKADPANHYKTLALWIGTIFASDNFDVNLNGTPDEVIDDKLLMNSIDSLQFDRLVLAFFLKDEVPQGLTPFNDQLSPIAFLKQAPSGVKPNQYFARLYYLGLNNYPTNVIPQFHAGVGDDGTPRLQNYLLATPGTYWAGTPSSGVPHYLNEPEQEFNSQFYDPNIFTYQGINTPYKNWGIDYPTNIYGGFEWFRYQIGPLEYAQLQSRNADRIKSYWQTCYSQLRLAQYSGQTIKPTLGRQNFDVSISASVTDFSLQLTVSNYEFHNTDALRIACYDALGRIISSSVTVQEVIVGSTTSINLQRNGLNGLLFFKVYEDGVCIGSTKALILIK